MDDVVYAERCRRLADAFVAAFPEYVRTRLARLVADPDALTVSIDRSRLDLDAALHRWAGTPAHRQRESPLELFREALLDPTQTAMELGAVAAERSDVEASALPGDVLAIAPATSQDLGKDAWEAHVAWGLARAEAIAGMVPRPGPATVGARVALLGSNLMDRAQIEEAAAAAGYDVALWRNPAALADGVAAGVPPLVFVDLAHPAAMDAIRALAGSHARVIAFGPHIDDHVQAAAGALGADEVLPRSRFFRRLPTLFPNAI